MVVKMQKQILHYPRLDTVLNVEKVIRSADDPLSKNEIDRRLPKQVMRPTLNLILEYLEESGKVLIGSKGIVWIYKEDISDKLRRKLERAVRVA